MTGPIEGLRVVDCSRGTAGPRATGMLADYGADVVWVEPPGGDPTRRCLPASASVMNRGKRSIEVDLGDPAAREALLALVDRAEVFVESWRPGVADRLGLGYDALHARNPALVYVSISGFGEEEGDDQLPGYEPIVQAVLGGMSDQVAHREGPVFIGFPFASLGAASLAVLGALAALRRARHDDFGRHVRTSLLDGALAYNSMLWGESDASQTALADAPLVFAQTTTMRLVTRSFECADGEYLGLHTGAVGAFGRAMQVLGLDDRIPPSADGMDIGVPLTEEQIPIIQLELVDIFKTKPRAEWVRLFLEADVCAVEHLRPTEVYDTPQARHNDMVVTVEDPVLGPVEQVAPAAKFSATPGAVRGPAPRPGEHTGVVLATHAGWPAPVPDPVPPVPDPRPLLADVRVLDLGAYYAGPYSSRLLADLGADVVKVEPLLGDPLRGIERPFFSAQAGKRALAANLKDPALAAVTEALLRRSDVVHHNLRPGAAERLGLDDASVRAVHPGILYLHAPGWGSSGPFAMRQSFAPMLSGYVGVTSEIAGRFNPPMPPAANEDPGNGLLGAIAILLGLLHRDRTGVGQAIENPQLNATMGHMAHVVRTPGGEVIGAGLLDPLQTGVGAFERLYQTSDGWVCVVAYRDEERDALLKRLGVERVGDDDRQGDRLAGAIAARRTSEVIAELRAADVAAVQPTGRNVHAFMNDPGATPGRESRRAPTPGQGERARAARAGAGERHGAGSPPTRARARRAHRRAPRRARLQRSRHRVAAGERRRALRPPGGRGGRGPTTPTEERAMGVDKFRYDGKRALVVGGASGMGAEIAKLVGELGGEVVVADILDVGFPVAQAIHLDLRDEGAIDDALARVGGPIDALFSCAGVSGEPFSPVDVMLVNFIGARRLVEGATKELMGPGSAIAFISSVGGSGWELRVDEIVEFLSAPDFSAARDWCAEHLDGDAASAADLAAASYVFSKQVIDVYVQLQAVPLGHRGIRINATAPGPTQTPLMDRTPSWQMFGDLLFKTAMQHDPSTAEDQAYPLVYLNSDAAAHVNGQVVNVDLGYTAGGLLGVIDCPLVQPLVTGRD